MLMIAGLLVGLLLLTLSAVDAGWQVIGLYFLMGLTGMQGAGSNLYTSVPVAKWFVQKRGRAMSLAFLGAPIGIFLFSPLTQLSSTLLAGVRRGEPWGSAEPRSSLWSPCSSSGGSPETWGFGRTEWSPPK